MTATPPSFRRVPACMACHWSSCHMWAIDGLAQPRMTNILLAFRPFPAVRYCKLQDWTKKQDKTRRSRFPARQAGLLTVTPVCCVVNFFRASLQYVHRAKSA
ncbi:unnamed protein product [Ectocarpus fasciculatus]